MNAIHTCCDPGQNAGRAWTELGVAIGAPVSVHDEMRQRGSEDCMGGGEAQHLHSNGVGSREGHGATALRWRRKYRTLKRPRCAPDEQS